MLKISNKKRELALLLASLIICFITTELFFRVFWKEPVAGWYGYPSGLYLPDETKGFKFKPNFTGFFPNKPYSNIEIKINSKGLRDFERDYKKTADSFRILALGDSVAFGSGLDFKDTYLYKLEEKMKSEGLNAEVIKTGVNSYAFDQEYTYYVEEGYKYDPDLIIVGIVLRDFEEITEQTITEQKELHEKMLAEETVVRAPIKKNILAQTIKENCRTCSILYRILKAPKEKKERSLYNKKYFEEKLEKDWGDKNWQRVKDKLLTFNNRLSEEGKKLVLVYFPYAEQLTHSDNLSKKPQEKLKTLEPNISFIDLTAYFDKPDYKGLYLGGDSIHPNSAGSEIASAALYRELLDKNLIGKNGKK